MSLPACYFDGLDLTNCGYCKVYDEKTGTFVKNKTNLLYSDYLLSISPYDYQKFLNRGWERCGTLCYLPKNDETCCPQYAIRLDATNLKPTKKQNKVMNKWKKFLAGEVEKPKENDHKMLYHSISEDLKICLINFQKNKNLNLKETKVNISSKKIKNVCDFSSSIAVSISYQLKKPEKAKEIAQEMVKEFTSNFLSNYIQLESISVSDTGHINFLLTDEDSDSKIDQKSNKKGRKLEMKLNPISFKQEEFELYQKYQMKIHRERKEDVTIKRYTNFLGESPIQYDTNPFWTGGPLNFKYGSFHLQYILDGQLIAVSDIDILPFGISSNYHFYDPDFSFLSLGVFSVMKECELIQTYSCFTPEFKYYYLGSYVHHNSKVNYKGNYSPSELLCPVTLNWVDFDVCSKLLDKSKFTRFSKEEKKEIIIHHKFQCKSCLRTDFKGVRYSCQNCYDFNLCEDCFKTEKHSHFNGNHLWNEISKDIHGPTINLKPMGITPLSNVTLTEKCKQKIELFKTLVGPELAPKFIFYLDKKDYTLPGEEIQFVAFEGTGRTLKTKKEKDFKIEKIDYKLDEIKPTTKIQFKLFNGNRLVQKFNLNDSIGTIYNFVFSKEPSLESFDLMLSHPRKN
eukprot:gene10626-3249_t